MPVTKIRTLEKKQAWIWGFKVPKRYARVISNCSCGYGPEMLEEDLGWRQKYSSKRAVRMLRECM